MAPGVIQLAFDPVLRLSETSSVRYETVALALVIFLGLAVGALIAQRTPVGAEDDPEARLRIDDLVFISVGSVPGAIIGGRLGYVLDHLDYYRANPDAVFDPAQGGLTLTLAVPLGILTGALVARLLGAPVRRWMHAATLPLLFVLAAGKLAAVLGGSGQGALTDAPWATSYVGPGPWGSLAAEQPAHPSQAYEALAVAGVILLLGMLTGLGLGLVRRRDGAALFIALALWALARFAVAFTWRDPAAVGPLRMEQALLLVVVVAAVAFAGLAARSRAAAVPADRPLDVEARPA